MAMAKAPQTFRSSRLLLLSAAALLLASAQLSHGEVTFPACEAKWQKAILFRAPRDAQSFERISEWSSEDYHNWLWQQLKSQWMPSTVFAGIALISLLILLSWRAYKRCTHTPRLNLGQPAPRYTVYMVPQPDAHTSRHVTQYQKAQMAKAPAPYCGQEPVSWHACLGSLNRMSLILSVVIGVLAVTSFGLTIWGITSASKGLAQQGWQQVDKTDAYVDRLANNVDALLANFSRINTVVDDLQAVVDSLQLTQLSTKSQALAVVLDSPGLSPTTINKYINLVTDDLQAIEAAIISSTQGDPNAQVSHTNTPSQVYAKGSTLDLMSSIHSDLITLQEVGTQVAGSSRQVLTLLTSLSLLRSAMANMPMSESPTAVTRLRNAIAEANLTSTRTALSSLSQHLATLSTASGSSGPVSKVLAGLSKVSQAIREAKVDLPNLRDSIKVYLGVQHDATGTINAVISYLGYLSQYVELGDSLDKFYSDVHAVGQLLSGSTLMTEVMQAVDSCMDDLDVPPQLPQLYKSLSTVNQAMNDLPSTQTFQAYVTRLRNSLDAMQSPLDELTSHLDAYVAIPQYLAYTNITTAVHAALKPTSAAAVVSVPSNSDSVAIANVQKGASTLVELLQDWPAQERTVQSVQEDLIRTLPLLEKLVRGNTTTASSGSSKGQHTTSTGSAQSPLAQLGNVTSSAVGVLWAWPAPRSKALRDLSSIATQLADIVYMSGNNLKGNVSEILTQYTGSGAEVRDVVGGQINTMRSKYKGPTTSFDTAMNQGSLVIFSLCLFVLVLLCVAMIINCPALFTLSTVIIALMVVLYFVMAMSMAFALAGGNDACPAVETIALSFVGKSPKVKTMAEHYFYNKGGNLTDVLAKAQVIDVRALDELVSQLSLEIISSISSLVTPHGDLKVTLDSADGVVDDIASNEQQLMLTASQEQFNIVYGGAKGYVCCTVPDQYVKVWYVCTFAGWVMLIMTWLSCGLIVQYNAVPASDTRKGWVCLTPGQHAANHITSKASIRSLSLPSVSSGDDSSLADTPFWGGTTNPIYDTGMYHANTAAVEIQLVEKPCPCPTHYALSLPMPPTEERGRAWPVAPLPCEQHGSQ